MHVSAQPYSVPKAGNSEEEYEDAYWPSGQVEDSGASFSFAVADGATEASYSKAWARILVEAYCNGPLDASDLTERLPGLQAKWRESLDTQSLPWYAEEKVHDGAFSSLLGLTIDEVVSPDGLLRVWKATAIGDSCLFQVRDDELIVSFPLTRSEQFNSRPTLVSSNPASNAHLSEHVLNIKDHWEVEDAFYLMTDALACWFLKAVEDGKKPWKIKRNAPEDFETWIRRLRKDGLIRNDDVTLFRVELLGDID